MKILQTSSFSRKAKKLHAREKAALDEAVRYLMQHPEDGELKRADLAEVRVYKYKSGDQLYLLTYLFEEQPPTITLLATGTHENFYRDLKNS